MQQYYKFLQKYGMFLVFSVVFWGFFIGALVQGWDAFSLLLFPLVHYLLYFWLQMVSILRNPYSIASYQVKFNTIGNQNQISKNFLFSAYANLFLIIIMGIESIYHPQLVHSYFVLYIIPIGAIFIFTPFLGLNKLLTHTQISLLNENKAIFTINLETEQKKKVIQVSIIVISSLIIFWILFSILGNFNIFTFPISVPGSEERLFISYFFIPVFLLSLSYPIVLLSYTHITILKKSITLLHENELPGKNTYLRMIRNYVLIPRFFIARS